MPRLVYYVTGHGLGHATRVAAVVRCFLSSSSCGGEGAPSVVLCCGAKVWQVGLAEEFDDDVEHRERVLDVGAVQADALTVDAAGSLDAYDEVCGEHLRGGIIEEEVAFMREQRIDVVATDVVPIACAAAKRAGVPCAVVSNFTWDYIYAAFVPDNKKHRSLIAAIHSDLADATCLLRMPGFSPMPAFRHIVDVPLVVRHSRTPRDATRDSLGIPRDAKVVLYQFGGQSTHGFSLKEDALPEGWWAVMAAPKGTGSNDDLPPRWVRAIDAYLPDVVFASDVLLGKIGYGTAAECLAHGRPLVFVRRTAFGEEPFLRRLLESNACAVEMPRRDFINGRWGAYLTAAARLKPRYAEPTDGAFKAANVLSALGTHGAAALEGHDTTPIAENPPEDAIVMPNWFGAPHLERPLTPPGAFDGVAHSGDGEIHRGMRVLRRENVASRAGAPSESPRCTPTALLEENDDTVAFLDALAHLTGAVPMTESSACHGRANLPEWRAACTFFVTEPSYLAANPLVLTRAPGRLDVMGGIADYSGAHVLEMPIAEACHVAGQLQPARPDAGRAEATATWLWRHVAERMAADPEHGAVVRVVSFHADASDRAPTVDVDVRQFFRNGSDELVDYDEARALLATDPARSWAAYIVGCLYALAKEGHLSVRALRAHSVALLVSSEVPEGKGVSSSAAVEVASMANLCVLFGITLEDKEFVRLCQRVENRVVGAPCGIMDQMSSAFGCKDELLYLRCTPDDVLGTVQIPHECVFWGIDSGIRHSVGGSDYGSVRCGTFMAKRLIADGGMLDSAAAWAAAAAGGTSQRDVADAASAGLWHLAHVTPSAFRAQCRAALPESMDGGAFVSRFGEDGHSDAVTRVSAGTTYAVRDPAEHPVGENFRVRLFAQLLRSSDTARWWEDTAPLLGELMHQSHASYGGVGLGSQGTDRLVALAAKQAPVLKGAKISGGGSGGTVVVMGEASRADAAVAAVAARYEAETGHRPKVFRGSSMGAFAFGALLLGHA